MLEYLLNTLNYKLEKIKEKKTIKFVLTQNNIQVISSYKQANLVSFLYLEYLKSKFKVYDLLTFSERNFLGVKLFHKVRENKILKVSKRQVTSPSKFKLLFERASENYLLVPAYLRKNKMFDFENFNLKKENEFFQLVRDLDFFRYKPIEISDSGEIVLESESEQPLILQENGQLKLIISNYV